MYLYERNRRYFPGDLSSVSTFFGEIDATAQAVWNANPAIHTHFGNDVQQFETQTGNQWNDNHGAHHHFRGLEFSSGGIQTNGGIDTYRAVYPAYLRVGITNPANWIVTNIRPIEFLGDRTKVHQDLIPVLSAIEAAIRATTKIHNAGVTDVQGFVPRPIRGGTTLSHHGVGRALDLNPKTNLRFRDLLHKTKERESLFRVIRTVTGTDLRTATDYASQRNASIAFQGRFTKDWVNSQRDSRDSQRAIFRGYQSELREIERKRRGTSNPTIRSNLPEFYSQVNLAATNVKVELDKQERLVEDITAIQSTLNKIATTGFLDLQPEVVFQFQAAGFAWGGAWSAHYKDYMHFQFGRLGP